MVLCWNFSSANNWIATQSNFRIITFWWSFYFRQINNNSYLHWCISYKGEKVQRKRNEWKERSIKGEVEEIVPICVSWEDCNKDGIFPPFPWKGRGILFISSVPPGRKEWGKYLLFCYIVFQSFKIIIGYKLKKSILFYFIDKLVGLMMAWIFKDSSHQCGI